ncbi:MAG: hypothetical protein EPO08_02375 [Rhodospirillaceae bacterium]|nr:MAG: hypothetical protein EPO08_02375 [Rhodospirillaceae bacterium]
MDSHRSLSRRRALAIGVSAGLALDVSKSFAAAANTPSLKATITLNGKSHDYAMRDGEDLGDFHSEIGGFIQRCVRTTRSDCPLIVYFRPDRDSERIEVVFELGRIWNTQPAHLDAYSVTITLGDEQHAAIEVPKHFWFSRWRWQSEPRPVVSKINDLIDQKLLPPYKVEGGDLVGNTSPSAPGAALPQASNADHPKGLPGGGQIKLPDGGKITAQGNALGLGQKTPDTSGKNSAPDLTYSIMGSAGITRNMGQTGERPDIGMVTEYQGRYIVTGAADALAIVRAQAEGAGTVPWHMRDEKTGAPVDLNLYSTMSWYGAHADNPHVATLPSDILVESSHQPALAYLPYILTGDPYHLEDLQFAANWNRGGLPPDYRLTVPQTRGFAWSMRTLAQAAKVTPASTPRWLLPRAYWIKELSEKLQWVTTAFVDNPDPLYRVFRVVGEISGRREESPAAPAGSYFAPWEDDFVAAVLGWIVLMGFEDWRKVFLWKLGSTLARTNGQSGWSRSWPSPYRFALRTGPTVPVVGSWAEAWKLNARLQDLEEGDTAHGDPVYMAYARAGLVMGVHCEVAAAQEPLQWISSQIAQLNRPVAYKWQLA